MLHAFSRNKSRAYRRYMGVHEMDEPRVNCEDEITSIVFGPLDFLSAADNWLFWNTLLNCASSKSASGPLPSGFFDDKFSPTVCELQFWPMKDRIEPDLLVRFIDATGQERSLLVEFKWNAPLSGNDQLEKQWKRYQKEHQDTSLHVFIAKNLDDIQGQQHRFWMNDEACRLRGVRWHTLRQEADKLDNSSLGTGEFRRWAGQVRNFLHLIGIRPFIGFPNTICKAKTLGTTPPDALRFWLGFPGFINSQLSNHVPADYANFWKESAL